MVYDDAVVQDRYEAATRRGVQGGGTREAGEAERAHAGSVVASAPHAGLGAASRGARASMSGTTARAVAAAAAAAQLGPTTSPSGP